MSEILAFGIEKGILDKLKHEKYNVIIASDLTHLVKQVKDVDLVLLDLSRKNIDEKSILNDIKSKKNNIIILGIIEPARIRIATKMLKFGLNDYIVNDSDIAEKVATKLHYFFTKDADKDEMEVVLGEELMTSDPKVKKIFSLVKKIANAKINILIEGENGTAQELYAKVVFNLNKNKGKFINVSCLGLTKEKLQEIEHLLKNNPEYKNTTVFFDKINLLDTALQIHLSKLLEEIEKSNLKNARIGDGSNNVKIIASSTTNLKQEVEKGYFKQELYFKINGLVIQTSSLKERRDFLPVLIKNFFKYYAKIENKEIVGITDRALKILENYSWPGNIQELRTIIYKSVILNTTGILDESDFLSLNKNEKIQKENKENLTLSLLDEKGCFKSMSDLEIEIIDKYLKCLGGNISEVSKYLGVGRTTLYRKLENNSERNQDDLEIKDDDSQGCIRKLSLKKIIPTMQSFRRK